MLAVSVVLTIVLAAIPAGAQDGIRIIGSGGSDELVPPPSPNCERTVFITEVSFDAAGNPIDIPRFGSSADLTQVYDVPDFEPLGPGTLFLDEVITYDGHIGRAIWTPQTQEQVYFEFLLDGVSQLTTPPTPDIPDLQRTDWLDIDMGTYSLPNGADTLRIHHVGSPPENVDSLVVSAMCGRLVPFAEEATTTTEAATTTVVESTTAAPTTTTAVTTTNPETTTTISTEVGGQVEERPPAPTLAVTGRTQQAAIGFAVLSLGLGILLMALSAANRKSVQEA